MECPVCYSEFDRDTHKPKITQCGHSICEDCIKHMTKCCICKQEFQPQRDILAGHHGQRMAYFEDSLDRYMQLNSLRANQYGWNRPPAPQLQQQGYSTNFALLELIEKKAPKKYTTCIKSKEYEDFYCLDCGVFTCNTCIDEEHINHGLKKIAHDVVTTVESLNKIAGIVDKEIVDAVMMDDSLADLKQKNGEVAQALPEKINSFFDELIQEIQETRKKVLESVATSSVEKETKLNLLIKQNEELKSKFSDVGEGVHGMLQQIKESKFMFSQELKPKSEELSELHKKAQSSLTYLKAQSETDDLKVADFSHAKNNCLPKFRDALESTLRLSTIIEPSLEVSRVRGQDNNSILGDNLGVIPLDDLNERMNDSRSRTPSRSRSRSTGSRFARELSRMNLGLGNPQSRHSHSSVSANSRRLALTTSARSQVSHNSANERAREFRGYPWAVDARDELLDDERNYGILGRDYPHRNNYFGRHQNFNALEVIERITQAQANRASPTPTRERSSSRSERHLERTRSAENHSDGVENHSGTTGARSRASDGDRTRSRRSSHNSALNREVLHRAISSLNRMERAQGRAGAARSDRSSASSVRSMRSQERQSAPTPSLPTPSTPSLNFFSAGYAPTQPTGSSFFTNGHFFFPRLQGPN